MAHGLLTFLVHAMRLFLLIFKMLGVAALVAVLVVLLVLAPPALLLFSLATQDYHLHITAACVIAYIVVAVWVLRGERPAKNDKEG